MPFYVIYDKTTKQVQTFSPRLPTSTLPDHLDIKEFPSEHDANLKRWDEATLDFVDLPPRVRSDRLLDLRTDPDFEDVWTTLTPSLRVKLRDSLRRFLVSLGVDPDRDV